ncbi:hypothetical protein [Nonomuraea sp. NPDC049400]
MTATRDGRDRAARALMDGCHPGTGERLVEPNEGRAPAVAPGRHP